MIINWNGEAYLGPCLSALLGQDPPPDEVIVVDNHSEDGSRGLVERGFEGVRFVDTGANLGAPAARNRGLQEAKGDQILFLDNDVLLEPGALLALHSALDADPRCALVQVRSVVADRPELLHYDAADLQYLGTLVLHGFFAPRREHESAARSVGAFVALGFLVRREAIDRVGGFDPDLFILFEDNDLSWRLRMHGWSIRLATAAVAKHAAGTAGLSFRDPAARYAPRRMYLHARNRWLVLLQCARWRTLVLTLPAQCLYSLVYTLFAISRGGFLAAVRGHFAVVLALPRSLRRRRLQRGRTVPDRELLCSLPMTANPGLADGGSRAALRRGLDRCYAGWWKLTRRLCG